TFRPPATIIDAVDFFKQASRDYDKPDIPVEQRGVNLVLKLAAGSSSAAPSAEPAAADPFAAAAPTTAPGGVPQIQALSARFINLYDALKLVCDVTGMKFRIRGNIVMIVPANDPDDELVTRSYNVLATLQERVGAAQSELSQNQGAGGDNTFMQTANMENKQDWKAFFQQMGVKWPEGSSISYMATIGKLRVTNTAEQLAVFEQVLEDLNVTPRLIEIEARFVEVSQKDLNSLGFEWLLNSDFSFDAGGFLDKALNLKEHSNNKITALDTAGNPIAGTDVYQPYQQNGPLGIPKPIAWDDNGVATSYLLNNGQVVSANSLPLAGQYGLVNAPNHNASVNAMGKGTDYTTGQRYLSTVGNPISGEGGSVNDQFMRVNAFLGNADLSMILHMLSQRSDTDLLYAPKVVTKSGQEAIMKVVTEYIYPTEYEVQISQQSSSSSITSGGSSDPLAIVEPQNFEMREVGMILQVVPEVSSEGQMINLMLNPQVVSEPIWKNYGTRVPKTTYRAPTVAERLDMLANNLFASQIAETSYIELPMEQPFFHVRSVQTQLSVYNGATVVMGGLITEARKTMEDKIPYLGDLPYIGRFFRSRSEESDKRNLLVFVTARLVDPAGRSVRTSGGESALMSGGGAPLQQQAPAAPEAAAPAEPAAAAQ
ncbi:MAG: type II and III secretion system protein, partial [Kiritimatiellae bacterium]|nr:type II and III secretion system protein [Kiritimatiellia bacterium]